MINGNHNPPAKSDLKSILKIPLNGITDLFFVLKSLNEVIEAQTSGIFVQHHNKLIYIAAYGKNDYKLLNQSLYINESVEGRIFSENEDIVIEKSIENEFFRPESSSSNIILPMTIIGTHITHDDETKGGLIAFNRMRNTLFTDSDLSIMKKVSLYIASAIDKYAKGIFDKKLYYTNKEIVEFMPFPLYICSTKGVIEEYSKAALAFSEDDDELYNQQINEKLNLVDRNNQNIHIPDIIEDIINNKDIIEINNVHIESDPNKTYNLIVKYINPDRMIHNILFYLISTEDVNLIKQTLITSVAHELRTPMTAIMGAVQILLSDFASAELTPTQEEFLNILKNQSERFSTVLSTILDFKESTDSLGLKEEKTNLSDVINDIERVFANKLSEKDITIDKASIEDEITVIGEINSIKHIFNQIIDNSIKFSPENSTISIKDEGSRLASSKWYKVISVKDEGPGIQEDMLPKVFDSFSRDDEAVHTKIGTGLGLSIVKQLIDTMGGEIEVSNSDNGGLIVTLSFLT